MTRAFASAVLVFIGATSCAPRRVGAPASCSGATVQASDIPTSYRACRADAECVKVATDGCCSTAVGAVQVDFVACVVPATGGVQCDALCRTRAFTPPNAPALAAFCVAGFCGLR